MKEELFDSEFVESEVGLTRRLDLTEEQIYLIWDLSEQKHNDKNLSENRMLFWLKYKHGLHITRRTLREVLGRATDTGMPLDVYRVLNKRQEIKNTDSDKLLITSFVVGGEIDSYAYSELEHYISEGFEIFVVPLESRRKQKFNQTELTNIKAELPLLPNGARYLLDAETTLEKYNIDIINLEGSRQSYSHLRHINKNVIVPDTYFYLQSTPTELTQQATYTMTTGCINKEKHLYSNTHNGYLQKSMHKLGGIFIENGVLTQSTFQAKKELAEALIVGDLHLPYESPDFIKYIKYQLEKYKPKKVFLHDLLDLAPFSHHTHNNIWAKLKKENTKEHLEQIKNKITGIIALCDVLGVEINVVASNHDTHLLTGLMNQSLSKMTKEDASLFFQYGHLVLTENLKPLHAIFKVCGVSDSDINKLNFVDVKSECKSAGFILNMHGDAGMNGASFSSSGFKRIGVKAVVGHAHSCGREGDVLTTGTSSRLLLGYNEKGFSSWSNSNVIVKQSDAYHELILKRGTQCE